MNFLYNHSHMVLSFAIGAYTISICAVLSTNPLRVQRATTDVLTARYCNECFWCLKSLRAHAMRPYTGRACLKICTIPAENVGTCGARTTADQHKTTPNARQIH
jgi:hypothetical protein